MQEKDQKSRTLILFPVWGIILFLICYTIAAIRYPGGSQNDPEQQGFSIVHNYWCNLLDEVAINGKPNKGRVVAVVGMVFLCTSLAIFWWVFPHYSNLKNTVRILIRFSGIIAMSICVFLFSTIPHDYVINLSSFFGLIAACGTLAGLKKRCWNSLFFFGIFNLALVVLNNYVYYTPRLIGSLPVIQKISFLCFLAWFVCISLKIRKTGNS